MAPPLLSASFCIYPILHRYDLTHQPNRQPHTSESCEQWALAQGKEQKYTEVHVLKVGLQFTKSAEETYMKTIPSLIWTVRQLEVSYK